jgi:carbamoyl-phosphate synthase large subunit
VNVSPDHPIVVSEFIEGAREIELDGVAKDGVILTAVVSEHVENAGIHSGDATTVVPAQKLYVETVRQVRRAGHEIAKGLCLNGPFNIQFLAKDQKIKVIECNARAARSFPFVSKTVSINLADVATDVSIGVIPNLARLNEDDLPHVGVKAAMFSFSRLAGADPISGVEMASTGEVGCIGKDLEEAMLLALESTHTHRPRKGVLVSSGTEKDKLRFMKAAKVITDKLGLPIYATQGTAAYLNAHGVKATELAWPGEGENDTLRAIREGWVDLVINIPKNLRTQELTRGSMIRQAAVGYNCPLLTNMEKVLTFIQAIERYEDFVNQHELLALAPYKN